MNCRKLHFSQINSQKRLETAYKILGPKVTNYLIAFTFYLLGVPRQALSQFVQIPSDTLKSLFSRVFIDGVSAFFDRRKSPSASVTSPILTPKPSLSVELQNNYFELSWGNSSDKLRIPEDRPLLARSILLTFASNGLISYQQLASFLHLSPDHLRRLATKLLKEDLPALIDQRKGAPHDLLVTPQHKAELIQQFVLDLFSHGNTSSERLSRNLKERCQLEIPPRTIRFHLGKLGLAQIKNPLLKLVEIVKKTPESSYLD